ncbi:hypothetical protein HDU97_000891 [Phlyctochytrium planicorne]|nr:hypothetical protein HDU97_000879 [Phlyctochytrium planicorne]KAJ3102048.1 hypothetical protein HDU97_000891 [Phlyctochytrium planicorne]
MRQRRHITLLSSLPIAALLLARGTLADIQGYYKGCQGNWQWGNNKFRTPNMVKKFVLGPTEFKSVDCAIVCGTPNDYALIGPDAQDVSQIACFCVSGTDPAWVYDQANVPPMDDLLCNVKCTDKEKCGGVDNFGTHYATFLIADPAPSKKSPALSPAVPAALEKLQNGGGEVAPAETPSTAPTTNNNNAPSNNNNVPTTNNVSAPSTNNNSNTNNNKNNNNNSSPSTSTSSPSSQNDNSRAPLESTPPPSPDTSKSTNLAITLGVALSVILLLVIGIIIYCMYRRRRRANASPFKSSTSPSQTNIITKHLQAAKGFHEIKKSPLGYNTLDNRNTVLGKELLDIQIETTTKGWAAGSFRESHGELLTGRESVATSIYSRNSAVPPLPPYPNAAVTNYGGMASPRTPGLSPNGTLLNSPLGDRRYNRYTTDSVATGISEPESAMVEDRNGAMMLGRMSVATDL